MISLTFKAFLDLLLEYVVMEPSTTDVLEKRSFQKFRKIQRKTLAPKSTLAQQIN